MTIYTIGHSTRAIEELLELLSEAGVARVVDVRRHPGSRRYPHFAREALATSLSVAGIGYAHEPDLGGRRSPGSHSPNTAWRNEAFRGYADHMASAAFAAALRRLVDSGDGGAVLCAEAVPWRCHRQLIADALVARGVDVRHLITRGRIEAHTLNPMARVQRDGTIAYPRREQRSLLEGDKA